MRTTALANLVNRRQRLLHLTTAGMPVTEAINLLSEELAVGKRTLWDDWKTKAEWLPLLLQVKPEDKDNVILSALAKITEATQEAYKTYVSEEGMARVSALRLYLEAVKLEIDIRQTLGLLPTEPLRIQQRIIMLEGRFVRIGPDGKPIDEMARIDDNPALSRS